MGFILMIYHKYGMHSKHSEQAFQCSSVYRKILSPSTVCLYRPKALELGHTHSFASS